MSDVVGTVGIDEQCIVQLLGRTGTYKVVAFPGDESLIGRYLDVHITGTTGATFRGVAASGPDAARAPDAATGPDAASAPDSASAPGAASRPDRAARVA